MMGSDMRWMGGSGVTLSRPAGRRRRAGRAAGPPVILVVGDSLSAEYGLKRGSGWVALLEQRLAKEKIAGAGGQRQHQRRHHLRRAFAPARAAAAAPAHARDPRTGGNDACAACRVDGGGGGEGAMTDEKPVADDGRRPQGGRPRAAGGACRSRRTTAADYAKRFADLYAKVAKQHQAALVPFLLEAIADGPDPLKLFPGPNASHPKEEAQPRMLENVWPN
jgi:acyl-CoA thioesterase-1